MNNKLRDYTKRNLSPSPALFLGRFSITAWLILINLVIFIVTYIIFLSNPSAIDYLALKPEYIFQGKYLWTIFTSMFMHASFLHLFVNMFSLFFIGSFIEKVIGKKRFIWFYLAAGVFAGLFFSALSVFFGTTTIGSKIFGSPLIYALGASGAIFGLLGLLAILTPNKKVYLIAGPLIAIILEAAISNFTSSSILSFIDVFINLYILLSIFALFSFSNNLRKIAIPVEVSFWLLPFVAIVPLVIIGFFIELPIGNMAHFGGLIAGLIYGIYLKIKYPRKIEMLNRMIK